MDQRMQQVLYNAYGIQAQSVEKVPGGWSASAWKVEAD